VLGGGLPYYATAVRADTLLPGAAAAGGGAAGGGGGGGGGGGTAAGAGAIGFTAFPPAGGLSAISGVVTGLAVNPAGTKAVLYVQDVNGGWWIKSYVGFSAPVSGAGAFSFPAWASNAAVSPSVCRRATPCGMCSRVGLLALVVLFRRLSWSWTAELGPCSCSCHR
jgi:hypothetical protein